MSMALLGSEFAVGLDWKDVAKGAAGALSKAGGVMSSGKEAKVIDQEALAERQRLEDQRRAAEEKAERMKLLAIGGALGLGGLITALIVRR